MNLIPFFICIFGLSVSFAGSLKEELKAICDEENLPGIAVAYYDQGLQIHQYGHLSFRRSIPIEKETQFYIGKLSEGFLSYILGSLIYDGRLNMQDPVSKFLPKSTVLPKAAQREISIIDLVSHSSGLPNLPFSNESYSHFSRKNLYDFLRCYRLNSKPGLAVHHSNVGTLLLTDLLTSLTRKSFKELLLELVVNPNAMHSICFSPEEKKEYIVAIGHQGKTPQTIHHHKYRSYLLKDKVLLFATISDLGKWMQFLIKGLDSNPILPIIFSPCFEAPGKDQMAVFWRLNAKRGLSWLEMKDVDEGYSSYFGLDKKNHKGVVILSNGEIKNFDSVIDRLGIATRCFPQAVDNR